VLGDPRDSHPATARRRPENVHLPRGTATYPLDDASWIEAIVLSPVRAVKEDAVTVLGVAGQMDGPAEQARAVIDRQTQHLARLVDDLLDVSRVTTGKIVLDCHSLDLAGLVANVLATDRASGRLDRHQVWPELAPVWIEAGETRMEQVVSNLVGNALKYTPAGGRVAVRVRPDHDAAVLEGEDTGVGIPSDLIGKVFDLFVQGDRALDRRGSRHVRWGGRAGGRRIAPGRAARARQRSARDSHLWPWATSEAIVTTISLGSTGFRRRA
jgi:signal transduction histidine kinase